jgi:hypothetical protein
VLLDPLTDFLNPLPPRFPDVVSNYTGNIEKGEAIWVMTSKRIPRISPYRNDQSRLEQVELFLGVSAPA